MTRIGILSVAFAAMLTVACGGDRRDDANRPANDPAAVGTAGEGGAADRNAPNTLDAGSRRWLEDMIAGNMSEVELGEMASQRAQNAEVKAFAQMLVKDHSKATEQLKQIASKHNVQPPAQLPEEHRDLSERLSKLQAREFDRDYIEAMVDKHEKTLAKLEDRLDKDGDDKNPAYTPKTSDNAAEMALNEWAAKTAPTVRRHLDTARELDQKMGRATTR